MFDIDYIVVPIDFSRSSRAALSVARTLRDKETHLELLHVVGPWPTFMDEVLFPYAPLGEDAVEIEEELVNAARASLREYHGLENGTEAVVAFGREKNALLEKIRSAPAQLVVLGAFGESGVEPDSLGSTARRVIRASARPSLLVRGFDAHPTISRILLALDLTEGSLPLVEFGVRLALRTGADLEILHVVSDPLARDQSNVLDSTLSFDREKVAGKARNRVEALFDRLLRDVDADFSEQADVAELLSRRRVVMGDPATEIVRHAQESDADVVVVGSQSASRSDSAYLGRVADAVARRSTSHVAVMPIHSLSRLNDDG